MLNYYCYCILCIPFSLFLYYIEFPCKLSPVYTLSLPLSSFFSFHLLPLPPKKEKKKKNYTKARLVLFRTTQLIFMGNLCILLSSSLLHLYAVCRYYRKTFNVPLQTQALLPSICTICNCRPPQVLHVHSIHTPLNNNSVFLLLTHIHLCIVLSLQ